MTRYADPRRCPDCAGPITPGVSSCPTCGLTLTGETAQGLFTTLTRADELLARLRSQSVPAVAVPFTTAPMPVQRPVATRQRTRLSAASVPSCCSRSAPGASWWPPWCSSPSPGR